MAQWDLLVTGAKVFDGEGTPGRIEDVAIKDGVVAARGRDLPRDAAAQCVDANNQWLLPGMLDIHTHLCGQRRKSIDPRVFAPRKHLARVQ